MTKRPSEQPLPDELRRRKPAIGDVHLDPSMKTLLLQ